jgi:hypothetical protein
MKMDGTRGHHVKQNIVFLEKDKYCIFSLVCGPQSFKKHERNVKQVPLGVGTKRSGEGEATGYRGMNEHG